jgi:chromate transporter
MKVSLGAIYLSFLRVGAVMFGGGYAMLPLLEHEVVRRRGWCAAGEMDDIYALAQVVPGVIAVNTALMVGQRLRGWTGAVCAALGAITAPFAAILLIATLLGRFAERRLVRLFLAGLRPAVAGLLLGTALRLAGRGLRRGRQRVVALAVTAAGLLLDINPAWVILAGLGGGLCLHAWQRRAARRRAEAAAR